MFYVNSVQLIKFTSSNFQQNQAKKGGALFLQNSQDIQINDCEFNSNSAIQIGGAIFIADSNSQGEISIVNSQFDSNSSIEQGGGIYINQSLGTIKFENTDFISNLSGQQGQAKGEGGALYIINSNIINILSSNLNNNSAYFRGAAIFIQNSENLQIQGTDLINNHDQHTIFYTLEGGALYSYQVKNILIDDCLLQENQAEFGGACFISESDYFKIQNSRLLKNNDVMPIDSTGGAINLKGIKQLFTFLSNTFQENYAYKAAAGYCQQVNNLMIDDNDFIDNTVSYEGGAMYLSYIDQTATIQNNRFVGNFGKDEGTLIFKQSLTVIIDNNLFDGNTGGLGSSLLIKKVKYTTVINSRFINEITSFTGDVGGTLVLKQDFNQSYNTTFSIRNITMDNNVGTNCGGIYLLNYNTCENCVVNDVKIINSQVNTASDFAFLQITKSIHVRIQKFVFNNIKGNNLIGIVSSYGVELNDINIQNFETGRGNTGVYIYLSELIKLQDLSLENSIAYNKPSGILALNSDYIELQDLVIVNSTNSIGQGGGIMIEEISNSLLKNILIKDSKANQGSGLYILNTKFNITLDTITLLNNYALNQGGGMLVNQGQNINIIDSKFNLNQADDKAGGIYMQNSQNIQIVQSIIAHNTASLDTGGIFLEKCSNYTIEDVQILQNIAQGGRGGMAITYSDNLNFNNITLFENMGIYGNGGGLYIYSCQNIEINYLQSQQNQAMVGSGLFLSNIQNLSIQQFLISQNGQQEVSQKGGGVHLEYSQDINFLNGQFIQNFVNQYGGAIYSKEALNLSIIDCKFQENQSYKGDGGAIFIDRDTQNILIENNSFSKNRANVQGGSIYGNQLAGSFQISNSNFTSEQAFQKGGSFFIDQLELLYMKNLIFQDIQGASEGGSSYLVNIDTIKIQNVQFQNNEVKHKGGCILVNNAQLLEINNSNFENCQAISTDSEVLSMGGSQYLSQINTLKLQNINVSNSQSIYKGGALYINQIANINIDNSNFSNNKVKFNNNLDILNKDENYMISQGGSIYISVSNGQQQNINIIDNTIQKSQASSGGGLYIESNQLNNDIIINLKGNNINNNKADIGSGIRIIGIDQLQIKNQQQNTFSLNQGYIVQEDQFYGFYQNEKKNYNSKDESFTLCPKGQFLIEGGQNECQSCLQNSECKGGYNLLTPIKEYWRYNITSDEIIYCKNNPEACLGHKCDTGYQGPLCESCDSQNQWMKDGNKCLKCQNSTIIILGLVFKTFFVTILILSSVKTINTKVNQKIVKKILMLLNFVIFENQLCVVLKIFISHHQILSVSSDFTTQIPRELLNYIDYFGNPVQSVTSTLECLFTFEQGDDIFEIQFYAQLVGYGILFISLFLALLFITFLKIKNYIPKSQYKAYAISTLVCFYLNVQPSIVLSNLSSIICRNIGSQSYSNFSLSLECDSDFQQKVVLPVNILILFIIVIVIPGIMFYVMYRRKNVLYKNQTMLRSLGILYIENNQNRYWWEFIQFNQKILIIFIATNFKQNQSVKSILIQLVILSYAILCLKVQPYKNPQIVKLSIMASFVQGTTIASWQSVSDTEYDNKFFHILMISIVIIVNTGFYLIMFKYILPQFLNIYKKFIPNKIKQIKSVKQFYQKEDKISNIWRKVRNCTKASLLNSRKTRENNKQQIQRQLKLSYALEKINYILIQQNLRWSEKTQTDKSYGFKKIDKEILMYKTFQKLKKIEVKTINDLGSLLSSQKKDNYVSKTPEFKDKYFQKSQSLQIVMQKIEDDTEYNKTYEDIKQIQNINFKQKEVNTGENSSIFKSSSLDQDQLEYNFDECHNENTTKEYNKNTDKKEIVINNIQQLDKQNKQNQQKNYTFSDQSITINSINAIELKTAKEEIQFTKKIPENSYIKGGNETFNRKFECNDSGLESFRNQCDITDNMGNSTNRSLIKGVKRNNYKQNSQILSRNNSYDSNNLMFNS